jgi:hypothetical protein
LLNNPFAQFDAPIPLHSDDEVECAEKRGIIKTIRGT